MRFKFFQRTLSDFEMLDIITSPISSMPFGDVRRYRYCCTPNLRSKSV